MYRYYLYKIDIGAQKVLVLSSQYRSEYEDLANSNLSNKHIRAFSLEDDVVELAESEDPGEKSVFCNESQAYNPNWTDVSWTAWEPYPGTVTFSDHQYVRRYRRECKMNYLKLGIYYNLQAKLSVKGYCEVSPTSTGTHDAISFETENCIASIRTKRIYKIRCQNETGWYAAVTSLTNYNLWKSEYNSYRGMRGLRKYWLKCGFYYRTSANGPLYTVHTGNLAGETLYHREISSGY